MKVISRKEAKEQGLKRYFTGNPCKHGHIAERHVSYGDCRECTAKRSAEYRKNNKDRIRSSKQTREYKAYKREYDKRYRLECIDLKERNADHYQRNKHKILKKKKERYHSDPDYRLRWDLRSLVRRVELCSKNAPCVEILGYTAKDLRQHLESQFVDGMSWDNRSEWHIDHIKPIKAFLDEGITDPAIINALDNLQPLWAHENLSKGAKYDAS